MLSERLDDGRAEAEDVALSGNLPVRLRTNGVARQLQLIADREDIAWAEAALNLVVTMKKGQRLENGRQHFTYFIGRQRTVSQDLRKVLLTVFHDDEEKLLAIELAAAHGDEPHEARMGESGNRSPLCELAVRFG